MSVIARILALGLLLWLPLAPAADQEFQEGVHYRRLNNPVPTSVDEGKIEVVEAFWYGCPHCYSLEPVIEQWLETKPENVTFERMPNPFGNWEPHARAFYAAKALDVLDRTHKPLYEAIHEDKRRLATKEQLAEFFAEQGVDKQEFLEAYDSFAVEKVWLPNARKRIRSYRITGVPAVIVNGKYVTSGSMAGSGEKVFEVVDYLVQQESNQG